MNRWGVHLANGENDIARILSLGCSNYTLLHFQAEYLPALREASPDGVLLMRYYAKNYLSKEPGAYARAVADEADRWRPYTTDWVFANEPNLKIENGEHFDDPDFVGNWLIDVAIELHRLCPWMRIHMPAFAPVGNWWEYFTNIAEWLVAFDVVDVHAYGELSDMVAVVQAVQSQTGKPLFVSELNGPGSLGFLKWVSSQPQVLGATYFIWTWYHADMPGWDRNLEGSALEQQIREADKTDQSKEELTMPRAAIAVVPSNQDANRSPIIPAYNEMGGMFWVSPLVEQALLNAGYNAKWFGAEPQSKDTYHLENLIKQTDAAHAWLSQQPETVKCAINLHTDSGDFSHTYGIYGSTREAESAKIALAVGRAVHEAVGTAQFKTFDKLGETDYGSYVFYALAKHPAVLIEICSHVNRRDIEALWANPGAVAQGILKGVQEYVGTSGVDWKAEAAMYRAKNEELTASIEKLSARLKGIKEYVAKN